MQAKRNFAIGCYSSRRETADFFPSKERVGVKQGIVLRDMKYSWHCPEATLQRFCPATASVRHGIFRVYVEAVTSGSPLVRWNSLALKLLTVSVFGLACVV